MELENLKAEVERLLSLLSDPQEGLMSWNMALAERLKIIKTMISEDFGI